MNKNTVNIARAISLLSDVLSRDALAETESTEADTFDAGPAGELDELKHQALEFGQEVVDDLDTISDELDRTLEANEFDDDDDDNWSDDGGDLDDDDDDDADEGAKETTPAADADPESPPESSVTEEVEALQKTTAALEKSNEELTDKVDDLTEALQHIDTLIDDLGVTAKEFVSEVETL